MKVSIIKSKRFLSRIYIVPEHNIIIEAIHELWSADVCMGESGASRMGRVGEVHPTVVPAAAVIKVAEKIIKENLKKVIIWGKLGLLKKA